MKLLSKKFIYFQYLLIGVGCNSNPPKPPQNEVQKPLLTVLEPCDTTYGAELLQYALNFKANSPYIEKNMNPKFNNLLRTLDTSCFRQQSNSLLIIFLVFEKQLYYRLSHFPNNEQSNLHDIPQNTGGKVLFNTLFNWEKKPSGDINHFYADLNIFSIVEHSAFQNHIYLKTIHAKNKQLHLKHYPKLPF